MTRPWRRSCERMLPLKIVCTRTHHSHFDVAKHTTRRPNGLSTLTSHPRHTPPQPVATPAKSVRLAQRESTERMTIIPRWKKNGLLFSSEPKGTEAGAGGTSSSIAAHRRSGGADALRSAFHKDRKRPLPFPMASLPRRSGRQNTRNLHQFYRKWLDFLKA